MIDIATRSQPGLGTVRRALSRRKFLGRAAAFGVAAPYSVFTEPAWRKQASKQASKQAIYQRIAALVAGEEPGDPAWG